MIEATTGAMSLVAIDSTILTHQGWRLPAGKDAALRSGYLLDVGPIQDR